MWNVESGKCVCMELGKEHSLVDAKNWSNKKTVEEALKEVGTFLLELLMTVFPMLLIALIFSFIDNHTFPWEDVVTDGELLWFSITSLTLVLIKALFSSKNKPVLVKRLYFTIVLFLLVFDGVFMFLKINDFGLLSVSINALCVLKFTIAATTVTLISKASVVLAGGGDSV